MALTKAQQIKGLRKALKNKKTPRAFIPSMKKRLAKLTGAAVLIAALYGCAARPAIAQTPVIIAPQQQTLAAAGTPCTGTAQTFPVNNRNQSLHFATAAGVSITSFQFVIQGVDTAGNVFNLSDIGQIGGSITGAGYFPTIQVQVTCLPATTGTFALSYSGGSSTSLTNTGAFLESSIDKLIFQNISATSNQNLGPFNTPYGNTFGKLAYRNTTLGATPTLTVTCTGGITQLNALTTYTFNAISAIGLQVFPVPAGECPQVSVNYSAQGSPAGTFALEYIFDLPGAVPSHDPCFSGGKRYVSISQTSNTQIITQSLLGTGSITVCSINVVTATAQNVALVEGTGSTCGSSTAGVPGFGGATAATGWNLAANATLTYGNGSAGIGAESAPTHNICLFQSGTGQLSGGLSYVDQ